MTDYTAMDAAEMLSALRDDAQKWAQAFMQITAKYDHPVDEGDMIGWFANAIEQSHAVRRWALESSPVMTAAKTYADAHAALRSFKGPPQGREEEALINACLDAREALAQAADALNYPLP